MAPVREKTPKGELNLTQLRQLVKQYNLKMSVATKGLTRSALMGEIQKLGYKIDHANKKLVGTRGVKDKARRPAVVDMPPAKPKVSDEEKAQKKKARAEKKAQDRIQTLKDAEKQKVALSKLKRLQSKPKSDEELKTAYGSLPVGALNRILDSLPGTDSKGGGSKLLKLRKIIRFKGENKLKREILKMGAGV